MSHAEEKILVRNIEHAKRRLGFETVAVVAAGTDFDFDSMPPGQIVLFNDCPPRESVAVAKRQCGAVN